MNPYNIVTQNILILQCIDFFPPPLIATLPLANWHEHKHTPLDTMNLCAKVQPVATKECAIFVDQLTDRLTDLQAD